MRPSRSLFAGLTVSVALAGSMLGFGAGTAGAARSVPSARGAQSARGAHTASAPHASLPTIVIGSTNFTEQFIVANLYSDVLRHAGYKTEVKSDLGSREVVVPALEHGALDLEADYAGTLSIYLDANAGAKADSIPTAVPLLNRLLAKHGATVLAPSHAIDSNVFVVTAATAKKDHLKTISDLKPYASKLTLGGPPECPQRPTCLLGLEHLYGLHFAGFKPLDEAGALSVAALKSGAVQVVELFSSDGNAYVNHFVELTDNKHLQPADYIIPVIRKRFAVPGVVKALDALSAKLTTSELSVLNIKVNIQHESVTAVASSFLKQKGLT